jgi:hypothetical protein
MYIYIYIHFNIHPILMLKIPYQQPFINGIPNQLANHRPQYIKDDGIPLNKGCLSEPLLNVEPEPCPR